MIEILESRIAPAAVFYYTDVDGDHVKVSVTGTKTAAATLQADLTAAVEAGLTNYPSGAAVGKPHQLQTLVLGPAFAGGALSITATPSTDLDAVGVTTKLGDGFVNVGEIIAGTVVTGNITSTISLASVTVHGDLGQIVVGSSTATKGPGLGSLTVQSMGDFGTSTGANGTTSRFINGVTSIYVAHDVNGVELRADVATSATVPAATIGSVYIGGNLIGGSASDTGEIAAANGIGSVKILGSVIGGSATNTGRIATSSNVIGTKTYTGNLGAVSIGGDLVGGSGSNSGIIISSGTLGSVAIKGSVQGGSASMTGSINGNSIGTVSIGGDLHGTSFDGTAAVAQTANIRAQLNLKSVTIGGSVISGANTGTGGIGYSGAIQAGQTLGPVKIAGSILGTATSTVTISGTGLASPTKVTQDLAIGSVTVGGSSTYAVIEAGYGVNGATISGDAQIGVVKIGGDFIASDIIAGVKTQTAGADFGTSTDSLIATPAGDSADAIYAKIASITISGQIEGTVATGDSFGIEAQLIGPISVGGLPLQLKTSVIAGRTLADEYVSQTTGHDVHIREFSGT
jgi:hypothetical protein